MKRNGFVWCVTVDGESNSRRPCHSGSRFMPKPSSCVVTLAWRLLAFLIGPGLRRRMVAAGFMVSRCLDVAGFGAALGEITSEDDTTIPDSAKSEGVDPSHWQRVGTGVHVLGAKGDRPLAACRCLYPMRYKVDRCFAMTAAAQPRGGRVTGSVSVPVPHAVQGRSPLCDDRRGARISRTSR